MEVNRSPCLLEMLWTSLVSLLGLQDAGRFHKQTFCAKSGEHRQDLEENLTLRQYKDETPQSVDSCPHHRRFLGPFTLSPIQGTQGPVCS